MNIDPPLPVEMELRVIVYDCVDVSTLVALFCLFVGYLVLYLNLIKKENQSVFQF